MHTSQRLRDSLNRCWGHHTILESGVKLVLILNLHRLHHLTLAKEAALGTSCLARSTERELC
jgi:hypothetical protein